MVTKEQYLRYKKLQNSGRINMNDVTTGCKLAKLDEPTYEDIIQNYNYYFEIYENH